MAKTRARSTRNAAAPKSSSKKAPGKKAPGRKAPARKSSTRASSTQTSAKPAKAPPRVSTGRGPTAAEIGRDFVTRVNLGQFQEIYDQWYHPSRIESVEGDGQVWKGMKGIEAKNKWWFDNHDMHACSAEGPFVGATGFSVHYRMSFTPKGQSRVDMAEVGVYTVKDGKIVREEYMYQHA